MMKFAEFIKTLQCSNTYETVGEKKTSLHKALARKYDFWIYLNVLWIVIKARVLLPFKKGSKESIERRAFDLLQLIEDAGGHIKIENIQNVRNLKRPVVFVANHMSLIETFVLSTLIITEIQEVTTVVKSSLIRYPLFGPVLGSLNPICVDRQNPKKDLKSVLEKGREVLRGGKSVLIFPQSTRSEIFRPSEFNSLGLKLAERAGVDIMPIALQTDFLGIGKIIRDFGPVRRNRQVRFRFGQPQDSGGGKEIQKDIVKFIVDTVEEWNVKVDWQKRF